jgi:hypothetical protein
MNEVMSVEALSVVRSARRRSVLATGLRGKEHVVSLLLDPVNCLHISSCDGLEF